MLVAGTFLTVYCRGVVMKIGDGTYDLLKHKLIKADNCMSAATLLKSAGGHGWKVKRIRRRAQALRTKVRNVIRDLHRKTCSLLCKLQCHLPPSLGRDRDVTDRQQGHQQAVRNLMTFARQFRVTLNRYAADRGVIVTPVSEAYTTKTCTLWGPKRCGRGTPRELLWVRVEDGTRHCRFTQRCIEVSDTLSGAS
jgi:hypothetical protein